MCIQDHKDRRMKRQALKFRLKDKMRNRYALTNEQTNGWIGGHTSRLLRYPLI